jgi:hypothetical protein
MRVGVFGGTLDPAPTGHLIPVTLAMTTAQSTLPELLPSVRGLSRADKLRLIGILAQELSQEEGIAACEGAASSRSGHPFSL